MFSDRTPLDLKQKIVYGLGAVLVIGGLALLAVLVAAVTAVLEVF